jgi:hypothetical protein
VLLRLFPLRLIVIDIFLGPISVRSAAHGSPAKIRNAENDNYDHCDDGPRRYVLFHNDGVLNPFEHVSPGQEPGATCSEVVLLCP